MERTLAALAVAAGSWHSALTALRVCSRCLIQVVRASGQPLFFFCLPPLP